MAVQVLDIKCPGCGSPVSPDQTECEWCHRSPIIFTSFTSVYSMPVPEFNKYRRACEENVKMCPDSPTVNKGMALCFLKLKLFDKAYELFSKAMEDDVDDSESYFYAAVCLLKGKKAFLSSKPEINQILELMEAAVSIEERGIYYYFMAYIKYDYFKRKFLTTSPTYKDYLLLSKRFGCSATDIDTMFKMIGVEKIAII